MVSVVLRVYLVRFVDVLRISGPYSELQMAVLITFPHHMISLNLLRRALPVLSAGRPRDQIAVKLVSPGFSRSLYSEVLTMRDGRGC